MYNTKTIIFRSTIVSLLSKYSLFSLACYWAANELKQFWQHSIHYIFLLKWLIWLAILDNLGLAKL